ncbi:uncharacterized protein B0J16DRAFT_402619 [Fusarium flagelliforme]|uniref:Uncharacterized protein n=1 Tax=Fusarium flagelliforme TaxID=2675880 RepID=A0A395MEM9_9HYPO|nr:uncharacterized protein B0J16DRAFT_402619 [Fusarium flagelliforme]KAH7179183.1 hypothetical protein B0J16DRAFT_402619 [Fusarium flagelliforme]RFN46306.1 hypothetical protein FIE12Z_9460 [Fusarium flagelliforme]
METYVCEYSVWDKWQKEAGKIPRDALQQHAVEKGQTVNELLEQSRPLLCTEKITPEDREMGVVFLLGSKVPTLAQQFEVLEDKAGFLLMDIEWNYIQDAIDKQRIPIPVGLSGIENIKTETVARGEYLTDLNIPQLVPDTRSFAPCQQYGHSTPPPTPSSRLRDMLDGKYRDFLDEEEKKLESESTSEDDGEGIGNMVIPEPEKDEEYCPNTKKRSSNRTRKMTFKKKESDKMAQKNTGGSRNQKKLQEDSEAGEDSNHTQKTPTKRKKGVTPGESDPPSSGRIKLIVRTSRNATPTKPKGHKSVDVIREDPFAPEPAPVSTARSAVSAKHAIYAAMSTSAHFAQTAVRRSGQSNETEIPRILRNQIQPNELRVAFENIRSGSEGVRYADRASFAWTAEKADCAGIAFEADDANEVLTGEGHDAEGTA